MKIKSALALHKARRLAKTGHVAEAVERLKKIHSIDPDPRLLIQTLRLSGSREDMDLLVSLHPYNGAAMFTATVCALAAGDYDEAIRVAAKGLDARPNDPSLRAAIVIARSRAAVEPLNMAGLRESAKNAAPDIKARALMEVERGIIAISPKDRGAREKEDALGGPVGFVLDRLDDLAAIMGWMLSSLLNLVLNATDAKKRAVYRCIAEGDRLYSMRRKDEAAKRFEDALKIDPQCAEALESLSRHYLETGDVAAATSRFAELESALASAGDVATSHMARLRADIAFFNGEFKGALDKYAQAAKTSPHDHMAHYRKGLCHLRMNDEKAALECFKTALSMPNAGLLGGRLESLESVTQSR